MVNALFACSVAKRKRLATIVQFRYAPTVSARPIQAASKPDIYAAPGSPIMSHALISEAWAPIAVTIGPNCLPAKTKSACCLVFLKPRYPIKNTMAK